GDGAAPKKDDVSMPAVFAIRPRGWNGNQTTFTFQHRKVEQALAIAETLVRLLQGDHIGIDLAQHGDDPRRVEATIEADALVDIVGSDDRVARFLCAMMKGVGGGAAPVAGKTKHGLSPVRR